MTACVFLMVASGKSSHSQISNITLTTLLIIISVFFLKALFFVWHNVMVWPYSLVTLSVAVRDLDLTAVESVNCVHVYICDK